MNKPTNVGVVGYGYWGPNLVRNFRSAPDSHLKVVCDLSEDRLKHLRSLHPDVKGETNFDRMLGDRDLDAVVIATSVKHHFPMAKASLLAGKHTLIEKPMASSSAECEELIDIANRNGLVLMVGHTFLYSAAVRKIKEIVDNHDIGEIRYIASRRLNLGLFQKDINVTWDLAPHDISIILHIMQEAPHSVNCRGDAHITPGIEDVTSLNLQFAKEKSAFIHSSWIDPRKIRDMTIVGSERMIVYDDIAFQEKIKIYGDSYSPYIKQDEPLKTECEHFIECVRQGKTPLTSGENGMAVVRILEGAAKSVKQNGNPVRLIDEQRGVLRPVKPRAPAPVAVERAALSLSPALTRYLRARGIETGPNGSEGGVTSAKIAGGYSTRTA